MLSLARQCQCLPAPNGQTPAHRAAHSLSPQPKGLPWARSVAPLSCDTCTIPDTLSEPTQPGQRRSQPVYPTRSVMPGEGSFLVWLPGDDTAEHKKKSAGVVRAKAAAWGHRHTNRKSRLASSAWADLQHLAPSSFLQFPVQNNGDDKPTSAPSAESAYSHRRTSKCKREPSPPDVLLQSPSLTPDERFGRQLHFVLPRFKAIAGDEGYEWLARVAGQHDEPLLQGALRALVVGLDRNSTVAAQRRLCADVLPSTRRWLSHPDAPLSHSTVYLIFMLSFHELLVWSNAKAWMMHLWGLSKIIHHQGPQSFTAPFALRTFCWFRHFSVALDILLRRKSFLQEPSWMHNPWSEDGEKDLIDRAVDILVYVPGLIEKADLVMVGAESPKVLQSEAARLVGELWAWRTRCLNPYCLSHYGKIFKFDALARSIANGTFVDAFLARAIVLHLTTWLLLTRFRPGEQLLWPVGELVDTVLDICDEYAYRQDDAGMLPWTFSIRVALFTATDDASKPRGRELCNRLETRYSLHMLSDIIESLPGLNTKMQIHDTSASKSYAASPGSKDL
ncbi:hypothetical protein WHR41_08304 [Cladosporium halotolerans]|uniref:Uncharacterized protein n=1 Tax=Cladosporium halotolerans TaxID=1052096 RepID=A0AB34KDN8_9PEZI